MTPGIFGKTAIIVALFASLATIVAYALGLAWPWAERRCRLIGRGLYTVTALSVLTGFGTLGWIVFNRQYQYAYAFEHTDNAMAQIHDGLHSWLRLAATWSGQEGSFLLWATWTALIGFLVFAKAGKYELRVMPIFTSVLTFLCAILWKQTPFTRFLDTHRDWPGVPLDGAGLNASLQNYWMTIHPPVIFFGFASLLVPFVYALAGLIWQDYKGWTGRVFPYALLTSASLGLGLFMGGYWAYETQGWHGFWAWDPVENASFFPWLAITALVHGLVVQRSRGGMARTNTFLGLLAFWLFLLGTFLTRSGALSGKGTDGQMLSVHAFDNISKSGLFFMEAMLIGYGVLALFWWIVRLKRMPTRPTTGDSMVSRDAAMFTSILLMIVACAIVTLGTTTPLFLSWMHRTPAQPQPAFYNKVMLPLTMLAAFALGTAPWLAWKKTDPDRFLKKLLVPWLVMLAFGFFLLMWVQSAEHGVQLSADPQELHKTMTAWVSPSVQRVSVVALASLGVLAALSNAALAYRVFRKKPINAGGWLAHVGIGILIVGVIVSNTYERTTSITLKEGDDRGQEAFGYRFAFEGMTGKPLYQRPLNPEYDRTNTVKIRVTPPEGESAGSDGTKTYVLEPRYFVPKPSPVTEAEDKLESSTWPAIQKYAGHDLYVGFASTPVRKFQGITLKPNIPTQFGPYSLLYSRPVMQPGQYMGIQLLIGTDADHIYKATPGLDLTTGAMIAVDVTVPELKDDKGNPSAVYLKKLDVNTKEAELLVALPAMPGQWTIPLSITYKPWINLVWIGVIVAVLGTLLAMVRRMIEARHHQDDVDPPTPPGGKPADEEEGGGIWDFVPTAPLPTAPALPITLVKAHIKTPANAPRKSA